ncbi:MBL fold metallo-hydrolase [Leptospira semungkisensis]|uniref:MBL fold metallo-hydrolase n=1 Tax=Leptospira semungkisensis TaxID=2484985 RepID=A0A4R9G855_9LEPT|nr:MBL fold metallo-hydrolase [Leptospira semungkisensis]TGK07017.1 MBL fold metallo-hydrolase [Leptospira semungkisensis]
MFRFRIFLLLFLLSQCTSSSSVEKKEPNLVSANANPSLLSDGLYAIRYGKLLYSNQLMNSESEEGESEIVLLFYLLKLGSRIILIDTGISSKETVRKFGVQDWVSPERSLSSAGILPSSVQEIVLTHYHFDHAGGLDLFPDAKIYVRAQDWTALKKSNWFPNLERKLLLKERSKKIQLLDSSLELAQNFRILFTGGHTAGSLAVEWSLHPGKGFLITGDECYWIDPCKKGKGLPKAAAFSVQNNKEFLDYVDVLSSQGSMILTMHDPQVLSQGKEVLPGIFKLY